MTFKQQNRVEHFPLYALRVPWAKHLAPQLVLVCNEDSPAFAFIMRVFFAMSQHADLTTFKKLSNLCTAPKLPTHRPLPQKPKIPTFIRSVTRAIKLAVCLQSPPPGDLGGLHIKYSPLCA
jgi:hypothetical protein